MAVWTTPGTVRTTSFIVSGDDVIASVPLDLAPITWTDMAGESWGDLTFTVEDTAANRSLPGGADVGFWHDGVRVFGGTLVRRRLRRLPGAGRVIECDAVSYDSWLDWRIVPRWSSRTDLGNRVRKLTTDRQMVKDLVERRGGPLLASNATVTETNTGMDTVRAVRVSLREALELVADEAQTEASSGTRRFYVDEQRRVHWYNGIEGNAAPYRIADGSYIRDVLDTSGLVEHWSLREEGGTTNHGSQNVAHLTLAGSYTQGESGGVVNEAAYRAVRFTATGRSAKTSAPASLFPGDTFSLECWFRRSGTGTLQYLIVSTGGTDDSYEVFLQTDDKLYVRLRPTGVDNFVSTATVTDGLWHHLVVAHGPGNTTVYYDGAAWAGTHTDRVFGSGATIFTVSHATAGFVGWLQHAAVYSVKLSAATALAHYRQGISIAPEDIELEDDWGDVVHHAYVVGKNAAGSGWVYNVGSDFQRGAVQAFVERENADRVVERNRAGKAFLRRAAKVRGLSFSSRVAGAWRAGQAVYATDDTFGLSGDVFEVRAVNASLGVDGILYGIEAGVLKRSLLRQMRRRERRGR